MTDEPLILENKNGIWEGVFADKLRVRIERIYVERNGIRAADVNFYTPDGRLISVCSGWVNLSSPPERTRLAQNTAMRFSNTPYGDVYGSVDVWERRFFLLHIKLKEILRLKPETAIVNATEDPKKASYLVYPLVPEGIVTILYGPGGVGKGWIAMLLTKILATGQVPPGVPLTASKTGTVLYLDYEDTQENLHRRWRMLNGPSDVSFAYQRCTCPLVEDEYDIRQLIDQYDPILVIVDPLGRAAGGDLLSAEIANEFFDVLERLNRTILVLGHTPKSALAPDAPATIYGSAFFTWNCRNIWEVRAAEVDGGEELLQALIHRKTNIGKSHPPIGLRWIFDDVQKTAQVFPGDPTDVPGAVSLVAQGIRELETGPKTTGEIAKELGQPINAIRPILHRLEKRGLVRRLGTAPDGRRGRPATVWVLNRRSPPPAPPHQPGSDEDMIQL